jgi:hypothetical protein
MHGVWLELIASSHLGNGIEQFHAHPKVDLLAPRASTAIVTYLSLHRAAYRSIKAGHLDAAHGQPAKHDMPQGDEHRRLSTKAG